MELKIVKTSSEDYQNLYKKYVTEMQANGVYETTESFFLKNDDKHALIFYNNNVALGFVSYRYDIFNLVSSHMYIDPTIRMIGVEETIIKVDSLVKVNDSIKIKVEQLDSIKNAKIVEVQVLDNDSTVKLFYELISK